MDIFNIIDHCKLQYRSVQKYHAAKDAAMI